MTALVSIMWTFSVKKHALFVLILQLSGGWTYTLDLNFRSGVRTSICLQIRLVWIINFSSTYLTPSR